MRALMLWTGPNQVFQRDALAELLALFDKDTVSSFFADEIPAKEVLTWCLSSDLFGSMQLSIIKGLPNTPKDRQKDFERILIHYAKNPNPQHHLLALWESPPKALLDACAQSKHAEVRKFPKAYEHEISSYIQSQLQKAGVTADAAVVDVLMQLANGQIEEAAALCVRLIEYAQAKGSITAKDAQNVLVAQETHSIFDLIDGVLSRDLERSLASLSDLRALGEPMPRICAMLLRSAKILWNVLARAHSDTLASDIGVSAFEIKKYREHARKHRLSLYDASALLENLARVEYQLKHLPEEYAVLEFERFLMRQGHSHASNPKTLSGARV